MFTFQVPDMTCGRCAGNIAKAIADVDRLAAVEVDIPSKRVSVRSTAGERQLLEAIRNAGYSPAPGAAVDVAQAAPRSKGGCCR